MKNFAYSLLTLAAVAAAVLATSGCQTLDGQVLTPDEAYQRLVTAYCTVPVAERDAFRAKHRLPKIVTCSSDLPGAVPVSPVF